MRRKDVILTLCLTFAGMLYWLNSGETFSSSSGDADDGAYSRAIAGESIRFLVVGDWGAPQSASDCHSEPGCEPASMQANQAAVADTMSAWVQRKQPEEVSFVLSVGDQAVGNNDTVSAHW